MCCSKKLNNLSTFIPPFSYNSHPSIPVELMANIPVYFLKTSCDCVFITHLLPTSL